MYNDNCGCKLPCSHPTRPIDPVIRIGRAEQAYARRTKLRLAYEQMVVDAERAYAHARARLAEAHTAEIDAAIAVRDIRIELGLGLDI